LRANFFLTRRAKEGRQEVLRTLFSIARASGRTSIVIMILLMLVSSESELFILDGLQFERKRSRNAAQKIEFVIMHGDGVQGFLQHILQMMDVRLLRLDCFLVLDESLE